MGRSIRQYRNFLPTQRNELLRSLGCGVSLTLLWWMLLQGINKDKWWIFRENPEIKNVGMRFGDLAIVAQWNDCVEQLGLSGSGIACDRDYPVGSVIITSLLGLSPDSVELWGVFLAATLGIGVSILIVISWVRQNTVIASCLIIAVISPATSLLLERGNLDIIMWIMALISLALIRNGRIGWFTLFICVGIAIKLYAVGMLGALFAKTAPRSKRTASALLTLAVALVVTGQSLIDDTRNQQQPIGSSFGALHLAYSLRLVLTGAVRPESDLALITDRFPILPQDRLISILLFASMTTFVWIVLRRVDFRFPSPKANSWFLGSAGIFLLIYVVTPSFDYRLTFSILVIFGLGYLSQHQSKLPAFVMVIIVIGLAVSTWLSASMSTPLLMIGDGVLWVTMSALAALVVLVLTPQLHHVIPFRRVSISKLNPE